MDRYPIWWETFSDKERLERLLDEVASLKAQLREVKNGNDPLNVGTRDKILESDRKSAELTREVTLLREQVKNLLLKIETMQNGHDH